ADRRLASSLRRTLLRGPGHRASFFCFCPAEKRRPGQGDDRQRRDHPRLKWSNRLRWSRIRERGAGFGKRWKIGVRLVERREQRPVVLSCRGAVAGGGRRAGEAEDRQRSIRLAAQRLLEERDRLGRTADRGQD